VVVFQWTEAYAVSVGDERVPRNSQLTRRSTKRWCNSCSSSKRNFEPGKVGVAVELMPFLQKWLRDHIMHTDKESGRFLNEKGIH
jgi:hemerythrin